MNAAGELLWETMLPARAESDVFLGLLEGEGALVLSAAAPGQLMAHDMNTGILVRVLTLDAERNVRWCAPGHPSEQTLLIGTDGGLFCYGPTDTPRWSMGGWPVNFAQACRIDGRPQVLAASGSGGWMGIDEKGTLQWEENRALGPMSGPPQMGDWDADGRLEWVYGSQDGSVRIVEIGQDAAPPPRVIRGRR